MPARFATGVRSTNCRSLLTLEEGGCRNHLVLQHCRGNAPHGQVCWVVELIAAAAREVKR
jgi:hypothetical protein